MSNNKKIYLALILWIVFFGILVNFYLIPSIRDLKEYCQRLAFQDKTQKFLEFRIEDFKNFQKKYPFYQPLLKKMENSFIDTETPIEFIDFLEQEAQKANISIYISPFSKVKTARNDFWKVINFKLTVKGDFSNCLKFLEKLEQSFWLIEITEVRVEKLQEEKGVNFSLNFNFFSKNKNENL